MCDYCDSQTWRGRREHHDIWMIFIHWPVPSRTLHCRSSSPLFESIFQGQNLLHFLVRLFFPLINTCQAHAFVKYDNISKNVMYLPKNALERGFAFAMSTHTKLMEYKIEIFLFYLEAFLVVFLPKISICTTFLGWPWCVNWSILILQQIHSRLMFNLGGITLYNYTILYYKLKPPIYGLWRRKVVFPHGLLAQLWERPRPIPYLILKVTSHKPSFTFKAKTFWWVRSMFWCFL